MTLLTYKRLSIPHLSVCSTGCPQTCYHWAAKVNQTDKRLRIHHRYKRSTSSERRTQHFCSSLSINSWLSVFGLSLRQPFSHERLTRSLPCRNQLPSFDESVPFISVNCLIKEWFLSFIVLILRLLVSHRSVHVKNMNFILLWFACMLVHLAVKALQCCPKMVNLENELIIVVEISIHKVKTYWARCVWVQKMPFLILTSRSVFSDICTVSPSAGEG